MTLSPDTLKAVRKYGKSVDGLARKRYGISGAALLAKTVKGESGDDATAVSNKGARGRAQFMPGSRDIARKKYGVDPYSGKADDEVHAMALHLRGKINGSKGLEGYNPGDPNYPKYILDQKVGDVHGGKSPKRTQQPGPTRPKLSTSKSTTTTRTKQDIEGALLDSLIARRGKKGSLLKATAARLDTGQYDSTVTETKKSKAPAETPKGDVEPFDAPAPTNGKVKFAPGADRAGAPTQAVVKSFLADMTRYAGTVTVGTGTNHSKMSSSGNVSDHWVGNGADIPARGARGDKVAYAAFRAAGVDEKTARRYASNGGLYNIQHKGKRVQIIWKTNTGGNHYGHVHVGIK